ncbi:MAG: phytoene desaturase family protein [Dehalococcoidales bacterium]
MRTTTDNSEKDLIIIGAGINGLSAGLAYALNNDLKKKQVMILEKNPISGGYVTSFARQGYHFDTCQMISNVSDILDYFGIAIDFHEFKQDFIRVFRVDPATDKVKTFELHTQGEAFEQQLIKLFPAEASKLKKLFDYSLAMFEEIYGLKYILGFTDMLKMPVTCPKVVGNRNKTFSQYLKMFGINDPEIGLMFQVFSGMCGLPNDRIAALLTVGVMYSLRERTCRPRGQFIELPQKMEQRYRALGGQLLLKSEVEKIIIDNGKVQGIRLKDGLIIRSRNIISTIDINLTMENLIGLDIIRSKNPRYAGKLESIKMTTSTVTVNLGIDDARILTERGLPCGYGLLTMGNDAYAKLFPAFENNEFKLSSDCFYLGYSCPPLTDNWKPVLSIQAAPLPVNYWVRLRNADKERYLREKEKSADILISIMEKYLIPDLRKHIVFKDITTPATYVRYSGSPSGSIYDMAAVPDNFGANRLPVITPIKGLLVPKFAHGVFGAMNSGLQAADILLDGKVLHGNSRFKKAAE